MAAGRDGKVVYSVGFIASGDLCGDLEFYSNSPISAEDDGLKKVFASYQLDDSYVPQFSDALLYAQMLYKAGMYKGAAPMFEVALAKLNESPGPEFKTMRRVVTDQAGMAYGISGDTARARSIFEKGIAADPDYPLYYYNLACADAAEKNLAAARSNLQKAFDRRLDVLPGERMPDPTLDDSFLPYRQNVQFWDFLESLRPKQ
jgi:tetratricopeptide (TPR) repeat protein